jgi:bifunctional non-homologous end joining protein LigD
MKRPRRQPAPLTVGGLKAYVAKRTFAKTPEPAPGRRAPQQVHRVFVVQKHAARALHYDLRLELQGVLKSWAVPKGPSLDPSVRRLAVMVEDHPLDYRDFEGVIPEGNYGAGAVIVWDKGLYHHPSVQEGEDGEKLLLEGLEKGDLKFVLHGEKLRGEFALVKTAKDDRSWLLIKKRDRYATPEDVLTENRSVASGRTLEQTAAPAGGPALPGAKVERIRLREALEDRELRAAPRAPMPRGLRPMLATAVAQPFDDPDWVFEVKWDGYRAVAEVGGGEAALHSRNLLALNERFPAIADALRKLDVEAVLDGEIVVVDDRGQPDFQMLQHHGTPRAGRLVYYVFDLPHLDGRDLTGLTLLKRKELLEKILPRSPQLRFSDHVRGEGRLFFEAAGKKGLEGIVAKHSRSRYQPGVRSRQWLKVKLRLTQDAVIAGFTEPRGTRRHFGALVLGAFAGKQLTYIGHVGGGFDARTLREIRGRLDPLVRKRSPFRQAPAVNEPVTWVKPELVCEVAFAEWTEDGVMRQPVFLRLREDKTPGEAVLERPGIVQRDKERQR